MSAEKDLCLPEGTWPLSFDEVRLAQHLRFRALSAREKIQALEDMAELLEAARKARLQFGQPGNCIGNNKS